MENYWSRTEAAAMEKFKEQSKKMKEQMSEMVVNENGAAQSKLKGAPRLVPPEAYLALSRIVAMGAERYAENNWRGIPMEDHVSHALEHIFFHMEGETESGEDHLEHALCRLAFAVATRKDFDYKQWRPLKEKAQSDVQQETDTTSPTEAG